MTRRAARFQQRHGHGRPHEIMWTIMQALSVLALLLMPINMAAKAQARTASTQGMAQMSDCEMGPRHQPTDRRIEMCLVACTALPPLDLPTVTALERTLVVPLTELSTITLAGTEIEPVPPPPRRV